MNPGLFEGYAANWSASALRQSEPSLRRGNLNNTLVIFPIPDLTLESGAFFNHMVGSLPTINYLNTNHLQ